jgi:hypothetical protein
MNAGGIIALFVGGAIAVKYLVGAASDAGRDRIADTILGTANIVRSAEGKKAAKAILNMKCLSNEYRKKILSPDFHLFDLYNVDAFPTDEEPSRLADMIVDSNYRIFPNDILDNLAALGLKPLLGAIDNPTKLMDAFSAVKTQVQCSQVNFWYFAKTKKDLAIGVQWLPDSYIIELSRYLSNLPVGLESKTTGDSLTELPNI